MGLGLKKTFSTGGIPVFQDVEDVVQGGFALDTTGLTLGGSVKSGSVMVYNETTRKASVLKTAKIAVVSGGTDVAYKVNKGSNLTVGTPLAAKAKGGLATNISAIDVSNTAYDLVTVAATLGVLNPGDVVFTSTAAGATAGAYPAGSKGLLYEDCLIGVNEMLTVVYSCAVYDNRINGVTDELKSEMPSILFSKSY